MSKSFPLATLLELSSRETETAAKHLSAANGRLFELEEKLQQLISFREEYQNQFRESVTVGLGASDWRNFHDFMDRLEAAIAQQGEAVELHRKVVVTAQGDWLDARRKQAGYEALRNRHVAVEQKTQAKREQREQDEQALQLVLRRRSQA